MELKNVYKEFISYNIFENAAPDLLLWIQERANIKTFDSPCRIIEEGQLSKSIYIVKSGPVRVLSLQSNGSKALLANLDKGNLVGEMSWLEDRPAVASVEVDVGSSLFEIPIRELDQIKHSTCSVGHLFYRMLAEKLALQLQTQNAWVHRDFTNDLEPLRKVLVLFAELNEIDISRLARAGRFKRLSSGEYLVKQGDEVKDLYLLLAGEARITISKGNELKHVGTSCKGEILGEITMLSPFAKGAVANVDTLDGLELLVIDKKEILGILKSNQDMAYRFYKGLTKMLSQRCRDQLLSKGLSEASRLAEMGLDNEQINDKQLSEITTAGIRFDWLCRQFQNKEG